MKQNQKKKGLSADRCPLSSSEGFTLMEIIVATTIFVVVFSALLALFNYTLRINRRSEALRQASQGMRNFVELLVKEVRNGQVDYHVISGQTAGTAIGPCTPPIVVATVPGDADYPKNRIGDSYDTRDNRLGITTIEGDEECIYLGYGEGSSNSYASYVGQGVFAKNTNTLSPAYNPQPVLVMQKNSLAPQVLNPSNFSIDQLSFVVRPMCDPYSPDCASFGNGFAKTAPMVAIFVKFSVQLSSGEPPVNIYYQTSVSPNQYDIPNQ